MVVRIIIFVLLSLNLILVPHVFARVSLNDQYQAKRDAYEAQVAKLTPANQELVKKADKVLVESNQKVLVRFDEDIAKMTAILEEYKSRQGLEGTETTVAYGQGDSPVDTAAYWLNYAAEAVAYQKIQDYTPAISGDASVKGAIKNETASLRADLIGLKGKILKAKGQLQNIIK